MVKGDIDPAIPIFVRVHILNPICDLTGNIKKDCGWPIRDVLSRISREERGVVVILCNQVETSELISQLESYKDEEELYIRHNRGDARDLRTIGLGAQILADLGVKKMIVLSAPKRLHAISGFGLEVVDYVT